MYRHQVDVIFSRALYCKGGISVWFLQQLCLYGLPRVQFSYWFW